MSLIIRTSQKPVWPDEYYRDEESDSEKQKDIENPNMLEIRKWEKYEECYKISG